MRGKLVNYDEKGKTLHEKVVEWRICWGETPVVVEIRLPDDPDGTENVIWLSVKQLRNAIGRMT